MSDEANAITRRDGKFRAFEQRRAAERQVNVFECQKRRCHARQLVAVVAHLSNRLRWRPQDATAASISSSG